MADDSGPVAAEDASSDEAGDEAADGSGAVDDSESSTDRNATSATSDAGSGRGRPEVVVPMDLYKTVTVFSTLFAVALVVGGMVALDAATGRATRAPEDVHLPIAFLGVASIVLGAAVYAFAARFRTEGMGNPKDDHDER